MISNTANTITHGTEGAAKTGFDEQHLKSFEEDRGLKTQVSKQAKQGKDAAKFMSPNVGAQNRFATKNFKEDIIDQQLPFQYVDPNMYYRTNQSTADKKIR